MVTFAVSTREQIRKLCRTNPEKILEGIQDMKTLLAYKTEEISKLRAEAVRSAVDAREIVLLREENERFRALAFLAASNGRIEDAPRAASRPSARSAS